MSAAPTPKTWSGGIDTQWAMRLIVFLIGCVIAITLGYWVGNEEWRWLIWCLFLFLGGLVVFGMKRRAWILIPLCWSITGYTDVLPLPFSVRDISILLAVLAYITFRVLSRTEMRQRLHPLDWVLGLNLFYLGITLCINPVGFWVFGSETIGARPYVSIFLAAAAYWVILRLPNSIKMVASIPTCIVVSAILVSLLYLTTYLFPAAPAMFPWLYGALDISTFSSSLMLDADIPRYEQLATGGLMLVLFLCSRYKPQTLLNPIRLRFYFLALAFAGVLAAGYRNVMLSAIAAFGLAAILQREWARVATAFVFGAFLLGVVLLGQGRLYELPLPAQRSLSFLPGQWSETVMYDVENSSQGRFQWWRDIIKYHLIHDWTFGDGFGANAKELQQLANDRSNVESLFLTGSYHSGPLTTIRYVGMIGLALLYILMFTSMVTAIRCVNRLRGTPLFAVAIFVAVQAIWAPFFFAIIFGSYDIDMPQQIFMAGLTRLLLRMVEEMPATATVNPVAPAIRLPDRPTIVGAPA